MKTTLLKAFTFLMAIFLFGGCACEPESIIRLAMKGMDMMVGDGFLPSQELIALGDFQHVSVSIQKTNDQGEVFLKLENGDPTLIGDRPEVLARKCAEIYLRDFENAADYQQITVQFLQSDPQNSDNFAMQEYSFEISDFF
ncbi:hypothetical protein [Algoriphagus hitonicola]|uniref:Uncharacterized protein n=1 Tax=Algoriphagus hitonicola TaxID=435880 RepID=A0A1I2UU25_9BACT|nr:hypothetical protein [Algoriphagus hitonicola]SFG80463.1 hypothetical protein SAMN04487988_108130 [Algoriphagus hitonicola]